MPASLLLDASLVRLCCGRAITMSLLLWLARGGDAHTFLFSFLLAFSGLVNANYEGKGQTY